MLQSAGFELLDHPEQEVFVCRWKPVADDEPLAVYPASA
jgi:hypothetical protein